MFCQVITEGLMLVSDGMTLSVVLHDMWDRESLFNVMQGSMGPLSVVSLLRITTGPRWAAESREEGGRILLDLRQVRKYPSDNELS